METSENRETLYFLCLEIKELAAESVALARVSSDKCGFLPNGIPGANCLPCPGVATARDGTELLL